MKRALFLVFLASCAAAQERGNVIYQTAGPVTAGAIGTFAWSGSATPIQGAPYSATITNESFQTLADGNRIVQTSTGTTARDSEGRTRQETELPAIGNLSAENAPRLAFIQDPITQTSYTLNLTEKTAQKMPAPPLLPGGGATTSAGMMKMKTLHADVAVGPAPEAVATTMGPPPGAFFVEKHVSISDAGQANTEELGSETMEGLLVTGVRTTRTIPAGEIGNERAITIVTEVWTSPDLKTVIHSKRTDPRMGEQIFRLTNIVRAEPSPSLFTVPADFKIVDGQQPVLYRAKP
jgi:hypothetical protein